MKEREEFKGNIGFIWLIGILVILLGSVTVYTLKLTSENNELKQAPQTVQQSVVTMQEPIKTESKTEYSYKEIEGNYSSDKEELTLYSNGMYTLDIYEDAVYGYVGNYIIDGESIILTTWLTHGSDVGYTFEKNSNKTQKYNIKNKDLIGNLKRTSKKINNEILKTLSTLAQETKEKFIW